MRHLPSQRDTQEELVVCYSGRKGIAGPDDGKGEAFHVELGIIMTVALII